MQDERRNDELLRVLIEQNKLAHKDIATIKEAIVTLARVEERTIFTCEKLADMNLRLDSHSKKLDMLSDDSKEMKTQRNIALGVFTMVFPTFAAAIGYLINKVFFNA